VINIAIIGAGYVGMSLAVLLSQDNIVDVLEIDATKVKKINKKQSTIQDQDIEYFLQNKKLNLSATNLPKSAYKDKDLFLIATPTDFNEKTNYFDASSVEMVIEDILQHSIAGLIVIKSTVPIGFTEQMNAKFNTNRVVFSPEFLREGKAIYDNLNPSRIIIGGSHPDIKLFSKTLNDIAIKKDTDILFMSSSEAEAIKLFSNTYLAMRVSFFNELDSFAMSKNLNSQNIIDGVSLDPRIGSFYNNPSFGYGGYCLPKDAKQLLAHYSNIPQELIQATISANETRKIFLADAVIALDAEVIGVYRLTMKFNSDNFRESATVDLINKVSTQGKKILIYEPLLQESEFSGWEVCKDIQTFKSRSDIILANRVDLELQDVSEKVFTRDIFGIN
tara:strand:+ start:34599 stop:35768 length:1170 start_codon:yes stop_codon:yes gene_type:complete